MSRTTKTRVTKARSTKTRTADVTRELSLPPPLLLDDTKMSVFTKQERDKILANPVRFPPRTTLEEDYVTRVDLPYRCPLHGDYNFYNSLAKPLPIIRGSTKKGDPLVALKEQSEKYIKALDQEDKQILYSYTVEYNLFNECLRLGKNCPYAVCAQRLDRILTSAPKTEGELMLFRGIDSEKVEKIFRQLKPGDIMEDRAFQSTAYSKQGVYMFFQGRTPPIMMNMVIPAGVPLLVIESISEHPTEQEVLLPPGLGLEFVSEQNGVFLFKCAYCTVVNRFSLRDQGKNDWTPTPDWLRLKYVPRKGLVFVLETDLPAAHKVAITRKTTKKKSTVSKIVKKPTKYLIIMTPEEVETIDNQIYWVKSDKLENGTSLEAFAPKLNRIEEIDGQSVAIFDWEEANEFRTKNKLQPVEFPLLQIMTL